MKSIDVVLTPIHKDGHRFIALFFLVSVALFFLWQPLGWVGLVASLWCIYFFRNPDRVIPDQPDIFVAPADGTVSAVVETTAPAELTMGEETLCRISIFLSVFDVHVNRVPAAGTVSELVYVPGQFVDAARDDASEVNERQLLKVRLADGAELAMAQVAGLVARRVLCDLTEGQQVSRGELFGLMRFGSRTDVYLPKGYQCLVKPGQTMIGGETVIAAKG